MEDKKVDIKGGTQVTYTTKPFGRWCNLQEPKGHEFIRYRAYIDNKKVGSIKACICCFGGRSYDGLLHLSKLYVKEEFRKKGIGRMLLQKLCNVARYTYTELSFRKEIDAQAFVFINRLRQKHNFTMEQNEDNKKFWEIVYQLRENKIHE